MNLYSIGAASSRWDGWVWPVPIWNDRDPDVSDHFQTTESDSHRSHLGVDIMFHRLKSEPIKLPNSSKGFAMPDGTPVVAVGPGKIHSFGLTKRNHFVTIDHGKVNGRPMATFYQHLSKLATGLKKGAIVNAGDYLGEVGGDLPPHYILKHLHFEIWLTDRGRDRNKWAVDPWPFLRQWSKIYLIPGRIPKIIPPRASRSNVSGTRNVALGVAAGGGLAALTGYALSRKRGNMV